ncbi:MAG TPA: heparan-alpha-glucosaminide N-acetyltransferase domain-containing protein, partial [Gemmatimonadales bacterium]|nr:heparan-alpha-glucosaminide N-acetyltransferase domain-containing protein [Gemmatimonadales bacterium]
MAETGVPIAGRRRVEAVDVLRGLVMVVMALDHTRDYFTSVRFDPLDLTQTTPALYYTRWITHLCAPAFVFLAGTGAFLSTQRGKTKAELSRFLWTRGLWLI